MNIKTSSAQRTFLIGNILFGVTTPLCKIILDRVPLSIFLLPKYFIPGLVTLVVALYLRRWRSLTRKQFWLTAGLGLLNVGLCNIFFYVALERVPVSYAMLVALLTPMTVYILAVIVLKEKIQKRALIGSIVSLVGVAIVFMSYHQGDAGLTSEAIYGIALLVGSLLVGALSTVWSKSIMKDVPILQFVTIQLLVGSIPFVFYFIYGLQHFVLSSAPTGVWLVFALVALLVTPLGFLTYFGPIRLINLEQNASKIYIQTAVGVVGGIILLNERLNSVYIFGLAVIIIGLWLGKQQIKFIWASIFQPIYRHSIFELIKAAIARVGIRI